jgi:hypothetical protein
MVALGIDLELHAGIEVSNTLADGADIGREGIGRIGSG